MRGLYRDLRFSWRTLAANRGFSAVAIVTLALGIGATTAIFSVVNAVLLRRLPLREPARLVVVWEKNQRRSKSRNVAAPANLLDWRALNNVFEDMAALVALGQPMALTGMGDPEELIASYVSPNFFRLMGSPAALGRAFRDEEGGDGGPRVATLSHGLWLRRFGADSGVIGRAIRLGGESFTVIGVMPPELPSLLPKAELWIPFHLDPSINYRERAGRYLIVIGRLKAGVTTAQAQTEMAGIAARLEREFPKFNSGWSVNLVPLDMDLTEPLRPALKVLMGAVGILLLIACANVANLQLARAAAREREMAVRRSLGAGRWRLVRQLLLENVLLAVLGGAAGCLLALWGVGAILAAGPKNVPLVDRARVDGGALLFSLGVSLVTGILFGLAPALRLTRVSFYGALQQGGRWSGGGQRLGDVFVSVQVALAVVLLIGAGLTIRSFLRLLAVDPGFRPQTLLTLKVSLPGTRYAQPGQRVRFFERAAERMKVLPGVSSASSIAFLPFTGLASATSFLIVGRPAPPPGQDLVADVRIIRPDYFRTMGIPLRRGRDFTARDSAEAPRTFIINETMARRHWPNGDPIGQRIVVNMGDTTPGEIVGVVGDTMHYGLDSEVREMVYYSHPHLPFPFMTFVIRGSGAPERLIRAATGVVRELDPEQPVSDVRTMDSLVAESLTPQRFRMLLLMVFSAAALVLATVGVYGVVSHSVSRRTREMGVRMALGARRGDILRLVMAKSAALAIAGVVIGLGGAVALTRVLGTLLYNLSPTDPVTFAAIAALMTIAAVGAGLMPARRATRVDPVVALRWE